MNPEAALGARRLGARREGAVEFGALDHEAGKVVNHVGRVVLDESDHGADALAGERRQAIQFLAQHGGHVFGALDGVAGALAAVDGEDRAPGACRLGGGAAAGGAEADDQDVDGVLCDGMFRHDAAHAAGSGFLLAPPKRTEQQACS